MHHAYTLLVMASIVASAPTYASGSCLSYGHSCWGAHGKRNGDETRWFVSKLAPLPVNTQARLAHLIFNQQSRTESEDDGSDRRLAEAVDDTQHQRVTPREASNRAIKRFILSGEKALVRPVAAPAPTGLDSTSSLSTADDRGGFAQRAKTMGSEDFILMGRPFRLIRFGNQIPKDFEENAEE